MSIADQVIIDIANTIPGSAMEGAFARVRAIAFGDHGAVTAVDEGRVRSVVVGVVVELFVAAEVLDGEEIRQRGRVL